MQLMIALVMIWWVQFLILLCLLLFMLIKGATCPEKYFKVIKGVFSSILYQHFFNKNITANIENSSAYENKSRQNKSSNKLCTGSIIKMNSLFD